MRTLQEKYNAIQEGKFSKDQFLVEARMQQPQLVTRFNGYDDAVQILKNRGMIQETVKEAGKELTIQGLREGFANYDSHSEFGTATGTGKEDDTDYLKDLAAQSDTFEEFAQGLKRLLGPSKTNYEGWRPTWERLRGIQEASYKVSKNSKQAQHLKKGDIITSGDEIISVSAGAKTPAGKVEVTMKTKNGSTKTSIWGKTTMIGVKPVTEAKLTKKSLTDYRYKPTNDMDKYPYEQILRGLRVELEAVGVQGTPTPEEYSKALAKVSKNLAKDSIFYTNQLAGNNKKVDLHDKFVDATAKNTVDTFNGMKKIKDLKESHTGNPKDKYVVRPCKNKKEPWAVWEGEERVKGFATKEQAKEYADKQNKKQGLSESVLKEGIKNLIKKALMENEEDIYEMQGPKTDDEYKNELADYLEDNQIYGYTGRIHDIMAGPDENTAAQELEAYLEDNQIYGRTYLTSILDIYSDYPYDEHWMNQPDEDEAEELPKEIPGFEGTRDALDDLFEAEDKEADKAMVRRLMAMYETEPSKFERLHKQTETQAKTTQDIAFRRVLSLMNRAKAGALQSLANQDRFEADREGINEESDDDKLARYRSYTYTLDGEVVSPKIGYYNNYIGAELDGEFLKVGIPSEDGVVQLRYPQGKQGMYTENIFKSVSLKDIL